MEDDDEPLLRVIAFTVQQSARQNNLLVGPGLVLTRFHTLNPPKIPLLKYLIHVREMTRCDISCFIVALILLDRLVTEKTNVAITPNTMHKLFLCAILIASKFNTDMHVSNTVWAAIGGVRVEELNVLELEFLFMLGFSLIIKKEEYERYEAELVKKAGLPEFNSPFVY